MRNSQSSVCLKTLENVQEIKIKDTETTIVQDKIRYRRETINKLRLRGYTNQQIAKKTGFSLSLIEKDLHTIRENSRKWFESESITEYSQTLQDAIILYDCGIEELQLLCEEEENKQVRINIWSKILEFIEKKSQTLEKTHSVASYLQSKHIRKSGEKI